MLAIVAFVVWILGLCFAVDAGLLSGLAAGGLAFVHFVGAFASLGALAELGLRNPETLYDSFTGDDTLDALCGLFWPLFWPCFLADRLARALARCLSFEV